MRMDVQSVRVMGRDDRRVIHSGYNLPPPMPDDNDPRMFRIEQTDDDEVTIRGGLAVRWVSGGQYLISLTCDGGPSMDPDNVKTETITETTYIYATLNSATAPATLAISQETDIVDDDDDQVNLIVGWVEFADSKITRIVQAHEGVWLSMWIDPDSLSVNYNDTSGELQIYEWDDAAITETALDGETDGFPFNRGCSGGALEYACPNQIVAAGEDGTEEWEWSNIPWKDHGELEDILGSTCADDHCSEDLTKITASAFGGSVSYITNEGGYVRNPMSVGIGSADRKASVGANDRTLYGSDEVKRVEWSECMAYDKVAHKTLDWNLRVLDEAAWSVSDETDATGAAGGAFAVAGGIDAAKKVWALGGFTVDADNRWTDAEFVATSDGGEVAATSGGLSLDATSGLVLQIGDGSQVKTGTWKKLSDITDPNTYVLTGA